MVSDPSSTCLKQVDRGPDTVLSAKLEAGKAELGVGKFQGTLPSV